MSQPKICINCLKGYIRNGVCTVCGSKEESEADRPVEALPGRYILEGQYYIGKHLGRGGFGITYFAWDMRFRRYVTVKELFPRQDMIRMADGVTLQPVRGQEEYVDHIKIRFQEEAQHLYEFQGERDIVNVYHFFRTNNTVYFVMEYLQGKDLRHLLKEKGAFSWQELSVHIWPVFRALYALHSRNLIHRDISPDNIFITNDGNTKLIDFGSVRSYNDGGGLTTLLKHNFAPWEQYRTNGNQGAWTDIYALCITMYYALTGILPDKAPDRCIDDKTVHLKTVRRDIPENVCHGIMKGMNPRIEDRYAGIAELAAQIFPGRKLYNSSGDSVNIKRKQDDRTVKPRSVNGYMSVLRCTAGYFQGKSWTLNPGTALQIGRGQETPISYPANYPGISRHHCTIGADRQGQFLIRDENSSFGTFVNGARLNPLQWYYLKRGCKIQIGNEIYRIV